MMFAAIGCSLPPFLAVSGLILILAYYTFDCLVRMEYTEHQADWIEDGKPTGMLFWSPPRKDRRFLSGYMGSNLAMVWLFLTPPWVQREPEARRLLRRYRVLSSVAFLGFAGAAALQTLLC